jgi:hypothetical protein
LTNRVLRHFVRLPRGSCSDVNCSIPFGEQDGIQIETLQLDLSPAIGGSETDPSHDIKTALGSIAFHPGPGLEISCHVGRSLVVFLESTRINLASGPPTIERQTIRSPKAMLNVVRNPHGFHLVSVLPKGQKWMN